MPSQVDGSSCDSKSVRLRGGRTVCDVDEVLAGMVAVFGTQPAPAVPEPLTFWDAQNSGWANAETSVFECMMDECAHVFPGRDGGRWVGLAEDRERPFTLGRICERCWPRWEERPWPWTLCMACDPPDSGSFLWSIGV